jgi:hypothetical protein
MFDCLQDRKPFELRESVTWSELGAVLSGLFANYTGRGLTADHLSYLARMAFSKKSLLHFAQQIAQCFEMELCAPHLVKRGVKVNDTAKNTVLHY